jgi:hypothetical protein
MNRKCRHTSESMHPRGCGDVTSQVPLLFLSSHEPRAITPAPAVSVS